MNRRVNPLGGLVFLAGLAAIALINWASGGHFFTVAAVAAVAYVAIHITLKVRRTRRRAETNESDIIRAKLSGGEAHIKASRPGRSQSRLNGRLQGIRDAKGAKEMAEKLGLEPALIFQLEAGTDQRWIGGYRDGVAEILPDAVVNVDYRPQQGSAVL